MTTQPEALRLADRLEGRWALHLDMQEAAAKLRHMDKVEAQRDALLEALKLIVQWDEAGLTLLDHHIERARAAIKAVEEGK